MLNCLLFVMFLPIVSRSQAYPFGRRSGFIPKDNNILLIIGQDKQAIDAYVNSFGYVPAGIMVIPLCKELKR